MVIMGVKMVVTGMFLVAVSALLDVTGSAQLLLRRCLFIEEVPVVVDQRDWWFTSLSPVIFYRW